VSGVIPAQPVGAGVGVQLWIGAWVMGMVSAALAPQMNGRHTEEDIQKGERQGKEPVGAACQWGQQHNLCRCRSNFEPNLVDVCSWPTQVHLQIQIFHLRITLTLPTWGLGCRAATLSAAARATLSPSALKGASNLCAAPQVW
jgi:hypothetical protein